jgi:hypothetical protein
MNNTPGERPRSKGTALILERHHSTEQRPRYVTKPATVLQHQHGCGVDWVTLAILSFAALCFAALALAGYLISAKTRGMPPF